MYEDIYNGLTDEERQRMLEADIPKFEVTGTFEMEKEEKEQAEKDLLRLIKELKENRPKK